MFSLPRVGIKKKALKFGTGFSPGQLHLNSHSNSQYSKLVEKQPIRATELLDLPNSFQGVQISSNQGNLESTHMQRPSYLSSDFLV